MPVLHGAYPKRKVDEIRWDIAGPQNPAVKMDGGNNTNMPVGGANSYTMAEARSHIMGHGYSRVTALRKDNSGVWRGMAMKDGQRLHVSVDYQGNVNAN